MRKRDPDGYRGPPADGGNETRPPANLKALSAETERELGDEAAALYLLRHMAVLFDRDHLLQTVTLPLERLGDSVARYLAAYPHAFADRSRLDESLAECARSVLPGLLTPPFVEEVRKHVEAALRRRRSVLDLKALITALILLRLQQTPEELAQNSLWSFLFRRSLMELLELPSRDLRLSPEVRDALRGVPLSALHEPLKRPEPAGVQQSLEDVYHGLESGYLREHLGFSYLVRFPFALAVLFPEPKASAGPFRDPEAERRLMLATVESVAREGAASGVVDEMLRVYRKAREAASGDRQRHFYAALVNVLETFEPEENPVLPALYYEHYLHYLAGEMEKDAAAIRDIIDHPLEAAPYDRYAETLRDRRQGAAARRVERIRDEVREWRARNM